MKTIYLVRHSESLKNKNIKFSYELTDQEKNEKLPLSIKGEEKAFNLAKRLFSNNIDEVWSSSYERAISTAKYIAELNNLEINISKQFNERKLGTDKCVSEEFWLTQLYEEDSKVTDGESRKEVCERMLEGIMHILNNVDDESNIVVVSHAAAITFLLMNWCTLVSAELAGKKRHLTFKEKDVINDSFKTPEVFKLMFNNNTLISVERVF